MEGEEIVKDDDKSKGPEKPTPAPKQPETPKPDPVISLDAFLSMFTLVRHIRWKYERLFRAKMTEQHTYSEWGDITGLGKEGK